MKTSLPTQPPKLCAFILALLLFALNAKSQDGTIRGTITDSRTSEPLAGATVLISGTSTGASTDIDGEYSFGVPAGEYKLEISYIGYRNESGNVDINAGQTITLNFSLNEEDVSLSEVTVVGSRNANRTAVETAVPVDIIPLEEIIRDAPQVEVTQILNYVAPSFTSNRQTISDGTDHVDPAALRGLGVDHVLVLINGKRRHGSALVNVNGTFGRGSVGTDLNTIPAAAIERIEVLRDGAAAQYGSDAIAGVINIVLKKSTDKVTTSVTAGQMYEGDGENLQFNANYGFEIGNKGYVNLTGQYQFRGRTDRSGEYTGSVFATDGTGVFSEDFEAGDFSPFDRGERLTSEEAAAINAQNAITNSLTEAEEDALINANGGRRNFSMKIGDSEAINTAFILNSSIPINDNQEFYLFGGLNSRQGLATGFYRLPNQSRNVLTIYPLGFLPEINTRVFDGSISGGIRGNINNWEVDFSNTYGTNQFKFIITNTLNASLGTSSPTSFEAGGFRFEENTTNLDFSRYFEEVMYGVNLAFGAEYRVNNYKIIVGEEGSYRDFGVVNLIDTTDGAAFVSETSTTNIFYGRPGGSQVFPGFQPQNEVNESRSNVSVYADVELNFTENFFISVAGRFEDYTDFGNTLEGKFATRWSITEDFAIRGAFSTGFRAPSLQQQFFNNTSTIFTLQGGTQVPNEVGTFRNDSRIAQLFGIPSLDSESSVSYSAGFTYNAANALAVTVDGYIVNVDDRVVLTGQFDDQSSPEIGQILASVNAGRAQLFSNAIDTETKGLDVIITYNTPLAASNLKFTLAANFNETDVEKINIPPILQADPNSFFNREEQSRFETAVPQSKITFTINYNVDKFFTTLTNVRFGEVTAKTGVADNPDSQIDQTFDAKIITDLSVGYKFTDYLTLTLGANNLFDVFPDKNRDEFVSSGRFIYSRRVSQFGFNGGFYFARLGLEF